MEKWKVGLIRPITVEKANPIVFGGKVRNQVVAISNVSCGRVDCQSMVIQESSKSGLVGQKDQSRDKSSLFKCLFEGWLARETKLIWVR